MIPRAENKAIKTREDYVKAARANKRTTEQCQRLHRLYCDAACPTCGTEIPTGLFSPDELDAFFANGYRSEPSPETVTPPVQLAAIEAAGVAYNDAMRERDRAGREWMAAHQKPERERAAAVAEAELVLEAAEQRLKETHTTLNIASGARWMDATAKRRPWRFFAS